MCRRKNARKPETVQPLVSLGTKQTVKVGSHASNEKSQGPNHKTEVMRITQPGSSSPLGTAAKQRCLLTEPKGQLLKQQRFYVSCPLKWQQKIINALCLSGMVWSEASMGWLSLSNKIWGHSVSLEVTVMEHEEADKSEEGRQTERFWTNTSGQVAFSALVQDRRKRTRNFNCSTSQVWLLSNHISCIMSS